MKKKYCHFLLVALSFIWWGCTAEQYTNQLTGTWVVEKFQMDGTKDLVGGDLKVNMVSFEKAGKCILPVRNLSLSRTANWVIQKKGDKYFLSISGAKDAIFNNDFELTFSEEKRGAMGLYNIVELKSHSLYWKCAK